MKLKSYIIDRVIYYCVSKSVDSEVTRRLLCAIDDLVTLMFMVLVGMRIYSEEKGASDTASNTVVIKRGFQ
jgi:ribosome-interacting GTPase 1